LKSLYDVKGLMRMKSHEVLLYEHKVYTTSTNYINFICNNLNLVDIEQYLALCIFANQKLYRITTLLSVFFNQKLRKELALKLV
jgi:hypothetical protein